MPHPHKLPTIRKISLNFTLYVFVYVVFFLIGKFGFPEIPAEIRLKLNQLGIMTVYMAGLLASLGFYWSSKAKQNVIVSIGKIRALDKEIELLDELHKERPLDHIERRRKDLLAKRDDQKTIRSTANDYPLTLERAGVVSIFVLAAGTLLQLLSLA